MEPIWTRREERAMERRFALRKRAIELLEIVNAEWRSDPMSVQCFDPRIVSETNELLIELKALGEGF